MKKIGLRHAPFDEAQIAQLNAIASPNGYAFIVFSPEDEHPDLAEVELLMGAYPPDMLKGAKALKWLQVPSAGVERYIADELYHSPDVILTSGSGAYGISISEYMLGGLLMIQRRMPEYLVNQKARLWRQYPGIKTLHGSSVAVIGVGDIGNNFARRCQMMGAHVTGVRRRAGVAPEGFERVVTVDQIDEAIKDADVVALCLPATEGTNRLIDEHRLARMKQGAILINVGRGSCVDEAALVRALESGQLGGALLDVMEREPLDEGSPLWDCPNAVITPHISGIDRDRLAGGIVFEIYRDNLRRYFAGQPMRNVIDRKRGY